MRLSQCLHFKDQTGDRKLMDFDVKNRFPPAVYGLFATHTEVKLC